MTEERASGRDQGAHFLARSPWVADHSPDDADARFGANHLRICAPTAGHHAASDWKTATVLGLAASMLSVASLIFQGFRLGISAPIAAMLAFYESVLRTLLGWAEAPLAQFAKAVGDWIGVSLHPAPEWKHVFVLVWLYFSTDARSSYLQKRKITGSATLMVGMLVSLAAVVASGGGGSWSGAALLWAMGVPIAGFLLHAMIESGLTTAFYKDTGRSIAQSLRYYFMAEVFSALSAGAAAIVIALLVARAAGASWAAIAALAGLVLMRGAFWLLRGVYIGVTDRAAGESWFRRAARSGSGQFGMLIFSVVLGALLFVTLNAGLG